MHAQGMFTAIQIADAFLKSSAVGNVLVVSGEYITHLTDTAQKEIASERDPRMACLTLGDSGAALTLESSNSAKVGFGEIDMYTLGGYADCCVGTATYSGAGGAIMYTDSRRIHEVAIAASVKHVSEILDRAGRGYADFDHFIMHQTASGAIDELRRQYNTLHDKQLLTNKNMIYNVENRANTATTSHFVALDDHIRNGRIKNDETVFFAIQASGTTLGAAFYQCGKLPQTVREGGSATNESAAKAERNPLFVPQHPASITGVGTAAFDSASPASASAVQLAAAAARDAIHVSGISPSAIDLVIYAGVHREQFISEPAIAAMVAGELSINAVEESAAGCRSFAFDVISGAAGSLNACQVATTMLQDGKAKSALVIAAEIEPNKCIDGFPKSGISETASAIVLQSHACGSAPKLVSFLTKQYSEDIDLYYSSIGQTTKKMPYLKIVRRSSLEARYIDRIATSVEEYLQREGLSAEDIKAVLPPQVSQSLTSRLASRLPFAPSTLVCVDSRQDQFTSSFGVGLSLLSATNSVAAGELVLVINAGTGIQIACALLQY